MSLEEVEKRPLQLDLFDYAGCGCFVSYEEDVETTEKTTPLPVSV